MFQPSVCYTEIILEEICLEGLDGITLETLWIRLETRLCFELPHKIKSKFWKIIQQLDDVKYYRLPKSRPSVNCIINTADINWTSIYPYSLVPGVFGSCKDYHTRIEISQDVQSMSFEEAIIKMDNSIVIVGSAHSRWNQLSNGHSSIILEDFSPAHYGILERIGRSRFNGEYSFGDYSLWNICKDAKNLHYNRIKLTNLGLITKKSTMNNRKTLLFHLPKFSRDKNELKNEKLEFALKLINSQPDRRMEFPTFKKHMIEAFSFTPKQWKFLQSTKDYKKHIITEKTALYREFYPDATEAEWKWKSIPEEKRLRTVRTVDVPVDSEVEDEDKTNIPNVITIDEDIGSIPIGEPLMREIYLCIRRSESSGVTLGEIKKKLGLDQLTVRLHCRILIKNDYVFITNEDRNKQTITRHYAIDFKKAAMKNYELAKDKIKDFVELNESLKHSDSANASESTPKVDVIKPLSTLTLRKLQRIKMIMDYIREKHVISQIQELVRYISQKEGLNRDGVGIIDKKSLSRLLVRLEKDEQLKLLRVKMPNQKFIDFICEPHIHLNHPHLKTLIEQTKTRYMIRANNVSAHTKQYSKIRNVGIAKAYGLVPKYARIRAMHEFIFYLLHVSKIKDTVLIPEIEKLIDGGFCSRENVPVPYIDPKEKYTFVSPLPKYEDYPCGWVVVSDIIYRIPLWLYVKTINTCYHIENLTEYLTHPIKRQLLINHLPENMKHQLLGKNRHISIIFDRLQTMCYMGLLRFGKQLSKIKDDMFIYLNPKTELWDTTSSAPGYDKVEDKEYTREMFSLETMDDVKSYWDRMQSICLNTSLGERYSALGEQVLNEPMDLKLEYALKKISVDDMEEHIPIPGDGCGAGGFDSLMFTHIKRSWSYSNIETVHQIKTIKRKTLNKNIMLNYKRKAPLLARDDMPAKITKTNKREKKLRTILPRKLTVVKRLTDDVDKSARVMLGPKRCTWNRIEDKILCMTIAARRIMKLSKTIELSTTIRDILHRCTNSVEKATQACRRRLLFLTHKEKIRRNIELHVTEMSCYPVCKKYEFIGRQINTNRTNENLEKLKIHFVELVHFLYSGTNEIDSLLRVIFPKSVDDFRSNFSIEPVQPELSREELEANFISDIAKYRLVSIIHSSLGTVLVRDKKKFLLTDTYHTFPEDMLASTLNFVRMSGLISHKKHDEFKTDKLKLLETNSILIRSQFKISISYIHHMQESLPYNLYAQAYEHLNVLENRRNMTNEPLNGGTTAAIFELLSTNNVSLDLTIPDDVIVTDYKYSKDNQDLLLAMDEASNDAIQNTSQLALGSLQIIDSGVNQNNDLCVNSCNLTTSLLSRSGVLTLLSQQTICNIINRIITDALYYSNGEAEFNLSEDIMKKMYAFIRAKREMGRTSQEIKIKFLNNNTHTKSKLCQVLNEMIKTNCIRRVGIDEFRWVSVEFIKPWCTRAIMCINQAQIDHSDILNTSCESDIVFKNLETPSSAVQQEPSTSEIIDVNEHIESETAQKRKLSENVMEVINIDDIGPMSSKKLCTVDLRDNVETLDSEEKSKETNKENYVLDTANTTHWQMSKEEISKVIDVSTDDEIDEYMNYISKGNTILDEANDFLNAVYEGENVHVISRPWIRPDGSLNNKLLWSWMGAVLNYLLYHPTVKISQMVKRFKFLLPSQLFLIIEILEEVGCVKKTLIRNKKATLFSTSRSPVIEEGTALDLDDGNLYIEVLDSAILKFAVFKGSKS